MTNEANQELVKQSLMLIPLIPLLGSAFVYFVFSRNQSLHKFAGWFATLAALSSFAVSVKLFLILLAGEAESIFSYGWTWFSVYTTSIDFALRMDRLSGMMTLIVTGVGSLIHLYAIGYMAEDDSRPRFFSYLNLFLFAMLLLVLGDNLLVMFVGWEGVGLCSYLLIGFWFKEMENSIAGQKAFVVNRIGDAGFILGIFTLLVLAGGVSFTQLQAAIGTTPSLIIEIACLLLFIGAVGKSAQVPLYIWLPDAMAGPTPVSALIHAATMVTAGIFMVTKLHFLFALAPNALAVIACVGALTAFVAATIALVQNDIKKVLAYSTVSQLGYMCMALGAGAFSNGMYHVVTHAFFKACLFMGAGSVIMGCHHEQDMRHFGGLWKKMPWTFVTYFIATLAIAGFPFLSGFYSKDAILWTVYSSEGVLGATEIADGVTLGKFLWAVGLLTAFLTAFYMTRSLVLTFFGSYRGHEHPHESPWVVTVPLVILAGLSAAFGIVWGEKLMQFLSVWTRPDMRVGHEVLAQNETYHSLEVLSIIVAVSGILLSFIVYSYLPSIAKGAMSFFKPVYGFLMNKWWVDEFLGYLIVKPLRAISWLLFVGIDRVLIDGSVNGTAVCVEAQGEILRSAHRGRIASYALAMFTVTLFIVVFYFVL